MPGPIQGWLASFYCKHNLHCGRSRFAWEESCADDLSSDEWIVLDDDDGETEIKKSEEADHCVTPTLFRLVFFCSCPGPRDFKHRRDNNLRGYIILKSRGW